MFFKTAYQEDMYEKRNLRQSRLLGVEGKGFKEGKDYLDSASGSWLGRIKRKGKQETPLASGTGGGEETNTQRHFIEGG